MQKEAAIFTPGMLPKTIKKHKLVRTLGDANCRIDHFYCLSLI